MARKAPPPNPGGRYTDAAGVEAMICSSMYFKHTSPKGIHFTEHRVWGPKRFGRSIHEASLKEGVVLEEVSAEDFQEWRNANARRSTHA